MRILQKILGSVLALVAIAVVSLLPQAANAQRGIARGVAIGVGAAIVGGIIVNELQRKKTRKYRRRPRKNYRRPRTNRRPHASRRAQRRNAAAGGSAFYAPAVASRNSERERTRKIQSALNTLGFEAGSADGVMGSNTRSAIRSYQESIGVSTTGRLSDEQFTDLQALSRQQLASANGTQSNGGAQTDGRQRDTVTTEMRPTAAAGTLNNGRQASSQTGSNDMVPVTRQPTAPRGPRVSADGVFTEYDGVKLSGQILSRSRAGRRITRQQCAQFCSGEPRCNAYISYGDGRCELSDQVGQRVPLEGAEAEGVVVGIRRTPEQAAAPTTTTQ